MDQMFDRAVLSKLRELGYDELAVSKIGMSTADDSEIFQWAIEQSRTVVTLDEHFGDWSVLPLAIHSGVIRLKVNPTTSENTLGLLLPFLANHTDRDFSNHLVIVRHTGIRWIRTVE
jgi:predicted nuclease of predicted toxin-antitoxin system